MARASRHRRPTSSPFCVTRQWREGIVSPRQSPQEADIVTVLCHTAVEGGYSLARASRHRRPTSSPFCVTRQWREGIVGPRQTPQEADIVHRSVSHGSGGRGIVGPRQSPQEADIVTVSVSHGSGGRGIVIPRQSPQKADIVTVLCHTAVEGGV